MNLLARLFGTNNIKIGLDHPDTYKDGPWTTPRFNITQQEIDDFYYYEALARQSFDTCQYGNLIPDDNCPGWFFNPDTGNWVVNP